MVIFMKFNKNFIDKLIEKIPDKILDIGFRFNYQNGGHIRFNNNILDAIYLFSTYKKYNNEYKCIVKFLCDKQSYIFKYFLTNYDLNTNLLLKNNIEYLYNDDLIKLNTIYKSTNMGDKFFIKLVDGKEVDSYIRGSGTINKFSNELINNKIIENSNDNEFDYFTKSSDKNIIYLNIYENKKGYINV
tara:strand:+ start:2146 stop:2706 length:561 start_codon:yes stop_codon:yes gene_type:complete